MYKGTYNFCVIQFADITRDRCKGITFKKVLCKFRPNKEYLNLTCITIMGNQVIYAVNAGNKTASLDICKLAINSVLSSR